jgi:hypothetical protein
MLDAEVLARLAFHECMHNKLRLGNETHGRGGLASASVSADTQLTEQNVANMAAAMKTAVPQWPEGFGFLLDRRVRRDAGDQLWYLWGSSSAGRRRQGDPTPESVTIMTSIRRRARMRGRRRRPRGDP